MIGRGPGLNGSSSGNGRRRPPAPTRPVPRRTATWAAVAERAVGLLYGEDEVVVQSEGEGMEVMVDDQRTVLIAVIAWFPGELVGGDVVVGAAMRSDGAPEREAMSSRAAVVAWIAGRRGVAMAVARQCGATEDRLVFIAADGGVSVAVMPRRGGA